MADLVSLDPFSLIKPRSQPDDPLGYWWQQVGNVGRATFGVEPVNTIPRPMLTQTYPDAWALAPHVAGMLSPYLAARDAATSMSEANRAAAAGDPWGAAKNLGLGALNMAAIEPVGRVVKPAKLAMDEVSRLSRADAMGFRRDLQAIIGTAPEGEKIAAAALKMADGRIFTGRTHLDALEDVERRLRRPFWELEAAPIAEGFATDAGRYVSRHEAAEIARSANQGETSKRFGALHGLAAEDITPAAAVLRSRGVRTAATAPGLMGGQGIWGRLDHLPAPQANMGNPSVGKAKPATTSVVAWPRTTNLGQVDALDLPERVIQDRLKAAWESGYDAMKVQNYIGPGSTLPETIIVTRDKSQWRRLHARFDPAKKDSSSLTAGLLPITSFGALTPFLLPAEERP